MLLGVVVNFGTQQIIGQINTIAVGMQPLHKTPSLCSLGLLLSLTFFVM